MIETIELENFKSHRDTKINLDSSRLHALVGPNSSGKTSVLQASHTLSQLAELSFEGVFQHPMSPESLATMGSDWFSVMVGSSTQFGHERCNWRAGYNFLRGNSKRWASPTATWRINQQDENKSQGWDKSLNKATFLIPEKLRYAAFLKFIVANLVKPTYSEALAPEVESDGLGLAPALDYIRDETPDVFQNIEEWLRRIVPGLGRIGIRRAKVTLNRQRIIEVNKKSIPYEDNQEVTGQEVILDMNTGERIPAHAISEGTMLALGLLTVLANPKRPNLVLLDDIEQGLHPKAQRELLDVFKEIIQANPDLQIIFTTHSPYIVDQLEPSQVHVLSNTRAGFTRCKRLDEHPDVYWAIQTLTTGEFLSAEGEDWVVAGEEDERDS